MAEVAVADSTAAAAAQLMLLEAAAAALLHPAGGATALSAEAPSITITYQLPKPPCTGLICITPGSFGSS